LGKYLDAAESFKHIENPCSMRIAARHTKELLEQAKGNPEMSDVLDSIKGLRKSQLQSAR
jgi:hypothetical protein